MGVIFSARIERRFPDEKKDFEIKPDDEKNNHVFLYLPKQT